MNVPSHNHRGREDGTILVMAVIVTVVIGLALAHAASTAFNDSRQVQYTMDYSQALSLADGVTEAAKKRLLVEAANYLPLTLDGTVDIDGNELPYQAIPVGGGIVRIDPDGATLNIQPYELVASVTVSAATATSRRVVELTRTPIFQYMIFYDGDLEVLPGPNMTLSGRVHANGNIHIGAGNTLSVDTNYLRCTGDILRERKNDGSQTGGTVDIKVFEQSVFENMAPDMDSDAPNWTTLAMDTWDGTVQSGDHGVTEAVVPEIGTFKAFNPDGTKGHYHASAELVIRDGDAFDAAGDPVLLPPGTVSEVTMYDAREGGNITVTQIDVGLLNSSGYYPANGLVYAYRTDASAAQPNGVRLVNGAELAGPLTVATEDPLFIQGDFNAIAKKPASVICDAINLLSNSWDDSKTAGNLPTAADTEYNVAVVTGNVPTPDGGGSYSGGFENLPRFHERWSGVTATIRGAFIMIYDSEIGTAPWGYGGDRYTAPVRDWHYDPDLQTALPPFTPDAVFVRRVMWSDGNGLPFAAAP